MSDLFDSDIFCSDYFDTYSFQSFPGWSDDDWSDDGWSDDYHSDDYESYLTPDEEYINSFELPSDEECKRGPRGSCEECRVAVKL